MQAPPAVKLELTKHQQTLVIERKNRFMSKGNIGLIGLTGEWRKNVNYDSYRVQVFKDGHSSALLHRLHHELLHEHGLREHQTHAAVNFKRKRFDLEASLESFFKYKSNTSVPASHVAIMRNIWIPFF